MNNDQLQQAKQRFPLLDWKSNTALAPYTYFKIGGPADLVVTIQTEKDLIDVIQWCIESHFPYTVLGGASNILIRDKGIQGVVILNKVHGFKVLQQKERSSVVEISSGEITNMAVRKAIDLGLGGLEDFLGIPGTIGGAVFNNSHYQDSLIGDHILSVRVIRKDGQEHTYTNKDMKFAYDYSILHDTHETVIGAVFELPVADKQVLNEKAMLATRKRSSTQPLGVLSSGCMFKNVVRNGQKESVGKLLDQLGLKGVRRGGAEVSMVHANFIVNSGNASAQDVNDLVAYIEDTVMQQTGLHLEREVIQIGEN